MKHAFLIVAHNEFRVLQTLVQLLDHKNSDIYIHFDAKVAEIPHLNVKESQLHLLQNRINVKWGGKTDRNLSIPV